MVGQVRGRFRPGELTASVCRVRFTFSARNYKDSVREHGGVYADGPGACHRVPAEGLCRERAPEELNHQYQVHNRYRDTPPPTASIYPVSSPMPLSQILAR